MKYEVVEVKLKTNRSRSYLWNNMNTPQKIIKIEGFDKNSKVRKISDYNYELISKGEIILVSFIPEKAVNQVFVGKRNYPLTWFEIRGEKNCTIVHGEHKRRNANFEKDVQWLKKHFLEELEEIAK